MIQINTNYRLNFDESNIIVEKHHPGFRDKKRSDWKDVAYFNRFESALKFISNQELKTSDSLEDLIKRLSQFEKEVDRLFKLRIASIAEVQQKKKQLAYASV